MGEEDKDYWKSKYKAELAKNKKHRKRKNLSNYVKSNIDLYKEILDQENGVLSKFKTENGSSRYFVSREKDGKQELIFKSNLFFQDLIEAKVLTNDGLTEVEQQNARRSMEIDALLKFFEKDRISRPGAGRKPSNIG
jgi:CTP:phosphocholine cytidylyltransferase-like protein